jgi:ectoine hydroxylase-related dioxygenase (phytanoyl-CoA dioxygenase family)
MSSEQYVSLCLVYGRVRMLMLGAQKTFIEMYDTAYDVQKNVVIFRGDHLRAKIRTPGGRQQALNDIHRCLSDGPGVFVIENLVPQRATITRANAALAKIIETEKEEFKRRGDHFAAAGANDRIWNSFEKHAMADPAGFADYYANDIL